MNQRIENLFASASNTIKAAKIRVDNKKIKAERRLRPTHGDGWEAVYVEELRKEGSLVQIQLQVCNMSSREVAEWIYELENKNP